MFNTVESQASPKLAAALQDIAANIQIQPQFFVSHPEYPASKSPSEVIAYLQQLPPDSQYHYRSLQIKTFLDAIYCTGSYKLVAQGDAAPSHQELENNTVNGLDLGFCKELQSNNHGNGYFDPDWRVLRTENSQLVVQKQGLTLHIEPNLHLQPADRTAKAADTVAVWMPQNLIQTDYYVAVGNAGPVQSVELPAAPGAQLVTVFLNISSQGVPALMNDLTQQLNAIAIPFLFKVLYNPNAYGRYDAGTLCFEKKHYPSVRLILQAIYTAHRTHFQPEVPLFAKQLAPGVAIAEEASHKFTAKETFGQNRCRIVANGLVDAWQAERETVGDRLSFIQTHFAQLGLEWQRPYLNADSEDVYESLP